MHDEDSDHPFYPLEVTWDTRYWHDVAMDFDDPIDSTDDLMCLRHVSDPHLYNKVAEYAEDGTCAVCATDGLMPAGKVVNIEYLAQVVHEVANRSYDHEGLWADHEQHLTPLSTEEVVDALLYRSIELDSLDVVSGLVSGLINEPRDWFEPWDDSANLEFEWDEFEQTVKHLSRLLLPPAGERSSTPPERTYEFMKSLLVFAEERAGLVHTLDAGTLLYRARIERNARELEKLARQEPATQLGPAPRAKASAGRMNAQGIPMFYVAFDEETACVEVASHSPYDETVVGTFSLQQPLRILDLSMVPPPRSPFDDTNVDGNYRLAFFSEYVERITRPVILDGNHPVDYAPTQVLTEFFRWATAPRLDGIVFPSRVRDEGKNAVLFFGDDIWFTQPGEVDSSMARNRRGDERGTEDPLFSIDPQTVRRYRVERAMTVKRTWF